VSIRIQSPIVRFLVAPLLAFPLAMIALGCGGSGPPMGRVSGTVSQQGTPLTKGNITFVPTSPDGVIATSQIGPDGTYQLSTAEYGPGAVVGDYQVAVTDISPDEVLDYIPKEPVESKSQISPKYGDVSTSGLTATVERGGNDFDFDLE
jgi:hypothetical protein